MPSDLLRQLQDALGSGYAIQRELGGGGMARVFVADELPLDRRVVIKVLSPELAAGLSFERFRREIGIAARLQHPHIVPVFTAGEAAGLPYYTMPFVEGESLRARLARGPMSIAEIIGVLRDVAKALEHAHHKGIVHRDIKPDNILLTGTSAAVTDFGISRAVAAARDETVATLTQAGVVVGTPEYMAPEQATADPNADHRADIYSLGCTAYELIAGASPFHGRATQQLIVAHLVDTPEPVDAKRSDVPRSLARLVMRCLAKSADERPQSAAEVIEALDAAASGVTNPSVSRFGTASRTSRRAVWATVAVSVVVGGVLLASRLARAESITSLAISPDVPDSTTAYLSEGVRDAVVDRLRHVPQLRVTAPSLVAQVRRQRADITNEELGRQLKVGAVLTWSLRRAGDSVHISAELLRIPGGDLLWAGKYDKPTTDLLAIEGELARTITDSLRLQLTGATRVSLARPPTTNFAAYDSYLRGRRFVLRSSPLTREGPALLDSIDRYARDAIARDSNFAAAYALLSAKLFVGAVRDWTKQPFAVLMDSSMILTDRTLALDSAVADPWENKITYAMYLTDDWPAAREAIAKATRLVPSDPAAWAFAAIYQGEVEGHLDSALVLARHATDLEPVTLTLNTYGDLLMRARRYSDAIPALRRAIEVDSTVGGPWQRLITVYERMSAFDSAVALRKRWQGAAAAPFERGLATGGPAGYRAALTASLRARIDTLIAQPERPRVYPRDTLPSIRETRIATAYAQLGDWKSAMDWIVHERQYRPRRFRLWVTNPDMAELRQDARFLALVKADGLEALLAPRRR